MTLVNLTRGPYTSPGDRDGGVLAANQTVEASVTVSDLDVFQFCAQGNDHVTLRVAETGNYQLVCDVEVRAPDLVTILEARTANSVTLTFDVRHTGIYTVLQRHDRTDHPWDSSGNYEISVSGISCVPKDLSFAFLETDPEEVDQGDLTNVSWTVENTGLLDATPTGYWCRFYLSPDYVHSDEDEEIYATTIETVLAAGDSVSDAFVLDTSPFGPGPYYVIGVVAPGGLPDEMATENNTAWASLTITPHCGLTISSTLGGTVIQPGEGTFIYNCGESVPVEAQAAACYEFVGWTGTAVDAGLVGDPNDPTITVTLDDAYTLEAHFAVIPRTLTISSTEGGSVTEPGEGDFVYDCGMSVPVLAEVDDPDSFFLQWTGTAADAGRVTDIHDPNTTVMVDDDYTLRADFGRHYTLTISSTSGGSVTEPGEDVFTYAQGERVDITAVAETCYRFSHWTGTAVEAGVVGDPNDPTIAIAMDADYTLIANFTDAVYCLEISSGPGGSVVEPGEGTFCYGCGETVTIVPNPNDDHHFVGWTVEPNDLPGLGDVNAPEITITVGPELADTRIVVTPVFAKNGIDVVPGDGGGGSVVFPNGVPETFSRNEPVRIVAEPDDCYHFTHWSGTAVAAGKVADPNAASTTVTVDADYNLTAHFALDTPTLTLSASEGGCVSVLGQRPDRLR